MENLAFLAILVAAACHAGWNALIKGGLDPLTNTTLIAISAGLAALVALPFTGLPAAAAWPWLCASIAVNLLYFAALIESYRTGDLGQIYPIARGSAPPMTAIATAVLLGEHLGPLGWIGMVILVVGVFLLSIRGGRALAGVDRRAIGFALFTSLTICAFALLDGIGARASGNPAAYALCLFIGIAVLMLPYTMLRGGRAAFAAMMTAWPRGLVGGALQLFGYTIVVWAMTVAPIAVVATLRETSVLFGAAIAVLVLKEPLQAVRIVAALLIVSGFVLIRLQ
jgi:drug/metabolite transporter (DMT)-like permease